MLSKKGFLDYFELVCFVVVIECFRFHAWSKTMEMLVARFLLLSHSIL